LGAALELGKAESEEPKADRFPLVVVESVESDAVAAGSVSAEALARADHRRPGEEKLAIDGHGPPPPESVEPPLPGEEAETVFLAEARERGEDVASVAAALAAAESEEEKGALPPLEELIQKLPAELRDTLDDLFRAKFVRAIRVRKKDLPA
jgi:hypothetical protein